MSFSPDFAIFLGKSVLLHREKTMTKQKKKATKEEKNKKRKNSKVSIIVEFWQFMRVRKKIWLAPIIIFLVLLGLLVVFTEGSAIAPFIYALF